MNPVIRPENEGDYKEVEYMTREAFWDVYQPGCSEHLVAHKLRHVPAFIRELDFVAVLDGRIVGNIMYSKAKVIDSKGNEHEVITFGPLSVSPSHQKEGIGSLLVNHTKKLAEKMGFRAIIIYGNPAYYHRFGFASAEKFQIATANGENFDAFMALELYDGAIKGITGKFHEDPAFEIDPAELEIFEKEFPHKEKHITDTQFK